MKPVNPFPVNFNTGIRTPESQRLLDEAKHKRKQVRLHQQTCALQPDLSCFTDKRSTRVDLSDIEDALM